MYISHTDVIENVAKQASLVGRKCNWKGHGLNTSKFNTRPSFCQLSEIARISIGIGNILLSTPDDSVMGRGQFTVAERCMKLAVRLSIAYTGLVGCGADVK